MSNHILRGAIVWRTLLVVTCVAQTFVCMPIYGATWYVATNGNDGVNDGTSGWHQAFATISNGVQHANTNVGDTVLVSNGIYQFSAQVQITNGITVRTVSSTYDVTIVDGGGATRCFYLSHTNALLTGFTITNGLASNGGGVYLSGGAMVSNCYITGNTSTSRVDTQDDGGGGVYIDATCGRIVSCEIIGNISSNRGGGVMKKHGGGSGLIRSSTIARNRTYSDGGGVGSETSANLNIQACTISENTAASTGGLYYRRNVNGIVENCQIVSNIAGNVGGFFLELYGTMRNCLIAWNRATNSSSYGGAGCIYYGGMIESCTIVSNAASTSAGGIYFYFDTAGQIAYCSNSIMYYNSASSDPNWRNLYAATATNRFAYCCTTPTNNLMGLANFTNDPSFIDKDVGDFRLKQSSPCVNAGDNQPWMSGARDLDDRSRIDAFWHRVDMGAYEYLPQGMLVTIH